MELRVGSTIKEDDAISEASSSDLPLGLLTEETYDSLICRSCVLSNPTLRRWAGTKGVMMVIRNSPDKPWIILDGDVDSEDKQSLENVDTSSDFDQSRENPTILNAGGKRLLEELSSEINDSIAKKARLESFDDSVAGTICLAPPVQQRAQEILSHVAADPPYYEYGSGDIFLAEGWRERWCRCSSVSVDELSKMFCL